MTNINDEINNATVPTGIMSATVFGIDLGTTNTCIAQYREKKFKIIEIDHAATVPSVVAFDGKDWLVGQAAKNYSKIDPQSAIASIKRQMGNQLYLKELGGVVLTPVEVAAKILQYVKEKAEAATTVAVKDVVITVPAYFNDYQRQATIEAGKLAGLNILRIVNEPTAASLVYDIGSTTSHKNYGYGGAFDGTFIRRDVVGQFGHFPCLATEEKWLVYDLGGGTFDVTVLLVREGQKEVLASSGNNFLGGDDFDRRIVGFIVEQIRFKHQVDVSEDLVAAARLKHLAESAKIALSVEVETVLNDVLIFGKEGKRIEINITITRLQFEEMIRDLIDSTIDKIKEVLQDANCRSSEINKLLLVGGSTRIPLVKEELKRCFNLEGQDYVDPDLSVALGACIQATICCGFNFDNIVIDVTPHSLGVAVVGELDDQDELLLSVEDSLDELFEGKEGAGRSKSKVNDCYIYSETDSERKQEEIKKLTRHHPKTFSPVIHRNTKLPAKLVRTYYTMFGGHELIEVAVYQGESENTRENHFVGSFVVNLQPSPAKTAVSLGMEYDLNGMVNITVSQDSQKKAAVKSYRMNLNRPASLNSETGGLVKSLWDDLDDDDLDDDDLDDNFDEDDFDDDDCDKDNEEGRVMQASSPVSKDAEKRVMNLLIQRIQESFIEAEKYREVLLFEKGKDTAYVGKLLERYTELLPQSGDAALDEIDKIEDTLYEWLDSINEQLQQFRRYQNSGDDHKPRPTFH
ncbi:MAG: Hsp70 family protein [Oligoflexia bacterium]|nr:Hsp70 family protein [Oligoflexia bacterium]